MAKQWTTEERVQCVSEIIAHCLTLYTMKELSWAIMIANRVLLSTADDLNNNIREIDNCRGVKHHG